MFILAGWDVDPGIGLVENWRIYPQHPPTNFKANMWNKPHDVWPKVRTKTVNLSLQKKTQILTK